MAVSLGRRHIVITPGGAGSTNFDITLVQSWNFPLNTVTGTFTVGESVSQASSSATGTVFAWDAQHKTLTLVDMVGTFDASNTITGGASGATGIPDTVHYAFPNGIRLSAVSFRGSANDILVIRDTNAVGKPIFSRKDSGIGTHESVSGRSLKTKPYISWSECTFTAPAGSWIRLEYD